MTTDTDAESASTQPRMRSAETDHHPGQVFQSRYRLLRQVGRGGMGEVWLAHHLTLDAEVAVKLANPTALGAEARDHLLHEARVLASLNHPSIVRVLDFGLAENSTPFMVMELLRGPSLRKVLARKGPLSPKTAARLLLPVASALAAAHARGVVHRDLKPDNVILVAESSGAVTPKVIDFGISVDGASLGASSEGTPAGSPGYMSPEQARGESAIDARTDVWAFCVLFHELVTGRSPFARSTPAEAVAEVAWGPAAPLPEVQGEVILSAILAGGLVREPALRWPTMQALGENLASWALHAGVEEDSMGTSLRTHWLEPMLHPLSDPPPTAPWAPGRYSLVIPSNPEGVELVPRRPRPATAPVDPPHFQATVETT